MKTKFNSIKYICEDCGKIYQDEHYSITQESQCPKCWGHVSSDYYEEWGSVLEKNKEKISFTKKDKENILKEYGIII